MTHSLSALMAPRSVAIVGASDNAARIGGRPLRYLREAGFPGLIYPVNPTRDTVQGLTSYPSLADLPQAPDVAILALPAGATPGAVEECAALGVKSAIIFSSGFAEADAQGHAIQDRMCSTARAAGMRLLGPNCLGVFNPAAAFYGTFTVIMDGGFIRPGPVGIVSQSGAYGSSIADLARRRGMGISQFIATGNECDIDLAEAMSFVGEQDDTRVLMVYAESVRNRDTFIAALKRMRDLGKAVVFMKTGRSDAGAEAAASHTAALAGSDAVFDAVLRQYGAYRARTTAEQLDIAYACAAGRYPKGDRIGIFTLSGGFGIQMADDAEMAGLDVAPMPDTAQAELLKLLPYASARNPVDATAQAGNDLPLMSQFMCSMAEHGGYDMMTGIFGTGPESKTFGPALRTALLEVAEGQHDRVLGLTMTGGPEVAAPYEQAGYLVYEDGTALVTALAALRGFAHSFARAGEAAPAPFPPIDLPATGPLTERAAKDILTRAGLPFPREVIVPPGGDIGAAAAEIGFPVVLKISSPDIAHKTEVGGVAVNIGDAEAARTEGAAILARAAEKAPGARIEGILVSPMIRGGVECIVGVARDPVLGPVVMFGLGGIFVEVLKDVSFRAAPFGIEEAHRMIRDIRGFALLQGVRGAAPSDIAALAAMLSDLSRFAAAHAGQIRSIDLNPVIVRPQGQGVVPLDALIELDDGGSHGH